MYGLPIKSPRHSLPHSVRWPHSESYLLLVGIGLLGFYVGAHLHSLFFSRLALEEFDVAQATAVPRNAWSPDTDRVDFSLWGRSRVKAYHAALALKIDAPIAVLEIRSIGLRAPVFDGTDDLTLNRGLGRIAGTGVPGSDGNVAIAGHRDGFFRGLKDIKPGDTVEVNTRIESDTYLVDFTKVVDPNEISVLEDQSVPTLTLITCYPFYFIGDAPHRFVVRASLKHRELLHP